MTIFKSIAVVTALFASGLVIAANTQDDAICSERDHTGYTLADGTPLPDASTFNPAAPLPTGMTNEGQYKTNFDCTTNPPQTCHYVYVPAEGQTPAKWVQCSGNIVRNN